jgi:hypothetical protein
MTPRRKRRRRQQDESESESTSDLSIAQPDTFLSRNEARLTDVGSTTRSSRRRMSFSEHEVPTVDMTKEEQEACSKRCIRKLLAQQPKEASSTLALKALAAYESDKKHYIVNG